MAHAILSRGTAGTERVAGCDAGASSDAPRTTSPREVIRGQLKPARGRFAPARWTTKNIPLQQVALDWLTLTTWERDAFDAAVDLLLPNVGASSDGRFLQYVGSVGDGYFYGSAEQAGKQHYCLRLSASVAHEFAVAVRAQFSGLLSFFTCTRADLQYTSRQTPGAGSLAAAKERLRTVRKWLRPGPPSSVEMYDSSDGLHTLYIGSRTSQRFQRVYVKPVDDFQATRWEVELKESLSKQLWASIRDGGISCLLSYFLGELLAVPLAVPDEDSQEIDETDRSNCAFLRELLAEIKRHGIAPERLALTVDASNEWKSLAWLVSSVLPCVERLAAADERVRVGLGGWLADVSALVGANVERLDVVQASRVVPSSGLTRFA